MVGGARGGKDEAAVRERGRAGEMGGEEAHEREVVRVDGHEGRGAVRRRAHHVREAVEREEQFRARVLWGGGAGELGPQGGEGGVGEVRVRGAKGGELREGEVGLQGGGEARVCLGEGERAEEGVGAHEAREEGGRVGFLLVERGGGAR